MQIKLLLIESNCALMAITCVLIRMVDFYKIQKQSCSHSRKSPMALTEKAFMSCLEGIVF